MAAEAKKAGAGGKLQKPAEVAKPATPGDGAAPNQGSAASVPSGAGQEQSSSLPVANIGNDLNNPGADSSPQGAAEGQMGGLPSSDQIAPGAPGTADQSVSATERQVSEFTPMERFTYGIEVSAHRDGYRRGGRAWMREPEFLVETDLTEAQVEQLMGDTNIRVVPARRRAASEGDAQ